MKEVKTVTTAQIKLAAESKALAKELRRIRQRHKKVAWPKFQGTKRELLEYLGEVIWLLEDAARTLGGKQ